jgi:hypothetical protein
MQLEPVTSEDEEARPSWKLVVEDYDPLGSSGTFTLDCREEALRKYKPGSNLPATALPQGSGKNAVRVAC